MMIALRDWYRNQTKAQLSEGVRTWAFVIFIELVDIQGVPKNVPVAGCNSRATGTFFWGQLVYSMKQASLF